MRTREQVVFGILITSGWVAGGFAGCSATPSNRVSGAGSSNGTGGSADAGASSAGGSTIALPDSGTGCPSTCAELGAGCGVVSDTRCGGVVQCTCNVPQVCGGDPARPSECGCTGVCASVPTCPSSAMTTLSGTVYDPAGRNPLYNALVYIPNDPSDPGLQPFTPGVTCDPCGATAAGAPLVSTHTAPDGTFTLTNVPVGAAVPLVIQLGRWRRQLTVSIATPCKANSVPAQTLTMPKTHAEGDIPFIGILSGALDPVECVLRKMGVADSEFTDPGNGGHVNFYLANGSGTSNPVQGSGAAIDRATPGQPSLFAADGGTPAINQYDMVILECEGYPQAETASDLAALHAYAEAGGRVFASDYAYAWLYQNGDFSQSLDWAVDQAPLSLMEVGVIDLASNPKGMAFEQWLVHAGVSLPGSGTVGLMQPVFHNSNGVIAPTQQWLHWGTDTPIHASFNTPVGAPSAQQCGRVVYSDWHTQSLMNVIHGTTFPSECSLTPMTPQEKILEFMLFDLSACVQPYTPVCTARTCAGEGITCGPLSDGCGNLLQCGACPAGQSCGGGGPGRCGTSPGCVATTCASQGIACGQAGDGCGNVIFCGNCPTGELCGASGPGQCGRVQ